MNFRWLGWRAILYIGTACLLVLGHHEYLRTEEIKLYVILTTSVWLVPWLAHVGGVAFYIYCFYDMYDPDDINDFNAWSVGIPFVAQVLLGLHLVFFRPGRTKKQRACRAGTHALLGVLTVVVHFWVIVFLINSEHTRCVMQMIYLLMYLFLILTPQFLTKSQAVYIANIESNPALDSHLRRHRSRSQLGNKEVKPKAGQD